MVPILLAQGVGTILPGHSHITARHASTFGEWRGGTSPSPSRRTVRDSPPSYGSHRPASGDRDKLPVCEQGRPVLLVPVEQLCSRGGLAPESFEFVHGPSDEMLVDAPHQGEQLGVVEDPVVVDPASHLGIDLLGDAGQVRARATVEVPGPDLLTLRLLRLTAHRWKEAHEEAFPSTSQATPEGIAEEIEAGVLPVPSAVRVFAVHDLRLVRVQLQTQGSEPLGDRGP